MAPRGVKPKKRKAAEVAKDAEAEDGVAGAAVKAAKPSGQPAPVFKVPEASEVLEIAQTRNLYKSNLFRLQLEELLHEIAPPKSNPVLETFLRGLQGVLEGLKARTIPEDFAAEFPHLPFHQRHPYPFDFSAPKRIDVVGGYLLGTCLRSDISVDIALEMPLEAFQSKDYLNFRYGDKRAAYAGEVHRQLEALSAGGAGSGPLAGVSLSFGALQGDAFRPCVCLTPAAKAWTVRLLPVYAAELWAPAKLAPGRNAVRPAGTAGAALDVGAAPATAQYNSCVLEDARTRAHLELLHRAFGRTPALRDAVLLLKRWAQARGFLRRRAAAAEAAFVPLSGFCLAALAAHAAQAGGAAAEAAAFQLFKLALATLATTQWGGQKLVLGSAVPVALSEEERRACRAHFHDGDGHVNFFWRLGPFIEEIQWEAKRSLRVLDSEADPFDSVFGCSASPELLWDLVVRTPPLGTGALCPDLSEGGADAAAKAAQEALGSSEPADAPQALRVASRLSSVLSAGLGDRALRTVVRLVGSPQALWTKKLPSAGPSILIGLTLDASNLDRVVDRGPSAQDAASSSRFRALWGPGKSEMRRFKDGSILHCSVWSKPPAECGTETRKSPAVVTQIVRHLAARHAPELAPGLELVSGPLGLVPNLGERPRRLWLAFEAFRTHVCQLSSLPIAIRDVHPVDAEFSYSEVAAREAPAAADGVSRTLHEVVLEFEASGRWPDDVEASRKVAGALLLQMREELRHDLGIEAEATGDFLDVRYPEATFRARIFHPQEMMGPANRVTNFQAKTSAPLPSTETMERLRLLWWRPRVRTALHGHVLQKPALAGTVRLCKRWMGSQMLAGYDEFMEHLAAAAFLQPAPFDTPTSPQVGFCRVCWLLQAFDWQHEPLIVDFDGKLSEEERLSMRQSFEARHADAEESAAFWVCSRFDPHALLLELPPATVAAWLRRRAQHALEFCRRRLLGTASAGSWQELFALDTSVFDLVVRLAPRGGGPAEGSGKAQRKARAAREAAEAVVEKLRQNLSPVSLVFQGMEGGVIGVKWRPGAFLPQHHSALMSAVPHTMVASRDGQSMLCVPNVLCLTSAIASLAEGLAVDVVVPGALT